MIDLRSAHIHCLITNVCYPHSLQKEHALPSSKGGILEGQYNLCSKKSISESNKEKLLEDMSTIKSKLAHLLVKRPGKSFKFSRFGKGHTKSHAF